jgi:hypothetical protein
MLRTVPCRLTVALSVLASIACAADTPTPEVEDVAFAAPRALGLLTVEEGESC